MSRTPLWTVALALMRVKEAMVRIEIELKNGTAHVGETLKHAKEAIAKAEEWIARAESSGRTSSGQEDPKG